MTFPTPSSPSPHAQRPLVIMACAASVLGSLRNGIAIAQESQLHGLDVDVRSSWLMPTNLSVTDLATPHNVAIRSIWLPERVDGWQAARRRERIETFLRAAAERNGQMNLILPRVTTDAESTSLNGFVRTLRRDVSRRLQITLAINAAALMRNADHLDRINAIRRAVEEWDYQVALDLTGDLSVRWETEAVIAKLGARLAVVRIDPWLLADGRPDVTPRGRLAARTIAMLVDQGYHGMIAVHADAPGWTGRTDVTASATLARALRDDIMQRSVRNITMLRDVPTEQKDPTRDLPER